jgi:hypothetical protein
MRLLNLLFCSERNESRRAYIGVSRTTFSTLAWTMQMSISAGRRRPGRNASEQSFFKWQQLGLRSPKGGKLPPRAAPRSHSAVSIEATAEAE